MHFVGRPRVLDQLRANGLTITEPDGKTATLPADMLSLHEDVPSGLGISLVLMCVKSSATPRASMALARALPIGTLVVCMQNGLHNAEVARSVAARLRFLSGMVPFNVAEIGPGNFLRGSGGSLALEEDDVTTAWLPTLAEAGLPSTTHKDIRAVQWGKLLLNLNNPVNALSGLPLRDELLEPDLRGTTALLIEEALARAGQRAPAHRQGHAGADRLAAAADAAAHAGLQDRRGPHAADRPARPLQHGRRPGAGSPHRDRRAVRRGREAGQVGAARGRRATRRCWG